MDQLIRVELPATQKKSSQLTEFGAESADLYRSAFDHSLHRTHAATELMKTKLLQAEFRLRLLRATYTKTLLTAQYAGVVSDGLRTQDMLADANRSGKDKRSVFSGHCECKGITARRRQRGEGTCYALHTTLNC